PAQVQAATGALRRGARHRPAPQPGHARAVAQGLPHQGFLAVEDDAPGFGAEPVVDVVAGLTGRERSGHGRHSIGSHRPVPPMQPSPIPAFADNYIWTLTGPAGDWLLVDPGDAAPVLEAAGDRRPPAAILLTHHHDDHVGGVPALLERWPGVPVHGPRDPRIGCVTHGVGDGDRVQAGPWGF